VYDKGAGCCWLFVAGVKKDTHVYCSGAGSSSLSKQATESIRPEYVWPKKLFSCDEIIKGSSLLYSITPFY
jgi:hypothetical protein